MAIPNLFKKKEHSEIIHYLVLIDAPLEVVGAQLAAWFDGEWRPSTPSALIYTSAEQGKIGVGFQCRGEFKKILKAVWNVEVIHYAANHYIHSGVKGFFTGAEVVTVEERDNGIKVDYRMTYELKNPIHQILWSLMMEDAFVQSLRQSMDALKLYCEKVKR